MQVVKKGVKKGISYEKTITYDPNQWEDIEKLNLTSLRLMCRAHGFQVKNMKKSKTEERNRLLSTRSHLRGIHGWDI